jgi:hypothetical protein
MTGLTPRGALHVIGTKQLRRLLTPTTHHLPFLMLGVSTLLAVEAPRVLSTDELIDYLYGDDPDGGPDYARGCIRLAVMRLRRSGMPIKTHGPMPGRGFRGYSYEAA